MSRDDPTNKDLTNMIKEFGATTEEELESSLLDDWLYVECSTCHKKVSLFNIAFVDDDSLPVCKNCIY
jgi:hypothetical protein